MRQRLKIFSSAPGSASGEISCIPELGSSSKDLALRDDDLRTLCCNKSIQHQILCFEAVNAAAGAITQCTNFCGLLYTFGWAENLRDLADRVVIACMSRTKLAVLCIHLAAEESSGDTMYAARLIYLRYLSDTDIIPAWDPGICKGSI